MHFFFRTSIISFVAGCGSVWLERRLREAEAASSNLVTPIYWKVAEIATFLVVQKFHLMIDIQTVQSWVFGRSFVRSEKRVLITSTKLTIVLVASNTVWAFRWNFELWKTRICSFPIIKGLPDENGISKLGLLIYIII